tara:strand:+ start:3326 stop:3562 length:237 start_codon:yes stop_codon:yes gene_type:complete
MKYDCIWQGSQLPPSQEIIDLTEQEIDGLFERGLGKCSDLIFHESHPIGEQFPRIIISGGSDNKFAVRIFLNKAEYDA